jgi:hypothetical protein
MAWPGGAQSPILYPAEQLCMTITLEPCERSGANPYPRRRSSPRNWTCTDEPHAGFCHSMDYLERGNGGSTLTRNGDLRRSRRSNERWDASGPVSCQLQSRACSASNEHPGLAQGRARKEGLESSCRAGALAPLSLGTSSRPLCRSQPWIVRLFALMHASVLPLPC